VNMESKSEVTMSVDILKIMLDEIRIKLPNDKALSDGYSQFKIAKMANPKMIFMNLGTYLLAPYADYIHAGSFQNLFEVLVNSEMYQINKKDNEEFLGNVIFTSVSMLSDDDKLRVMKNLRTLLQLFVRYTSRKGMQIEFNKIPESFKV